MLSRAFNFFILLYLFAIKVCVFYSLCYICIKNKARLVVFILFFILFTLSLHA